MYAAGVSPKVLFPPKGQDPDDWAKTVSSEELDRRISGAIPLMEYIERGASRKFDLGTISGKLSYVRVMEKYLRWIADPAERELYVQRVAQTAGLPVETIHRQLGGPAKSVTAAGEAPAGARDPLPEESFLLQLLAACPSLALDARRDGIDALLQGDDARETLAALAALADRAPSEDAAALLAGAVPDAVRSRLSAEIVRADLSPDEARRRFPALVLDLRIRGAQREIDRLQAEIRSAPGEEERASLFSRVLAAKKEKERLESERRSR